MHLVSSSSSVRVGVRVRPLVAKEKVQGKAAQTFSDCDGSDGTLSFKGQRMTFDHVFPSSQGQAELYQLTAAPMLQSFLDGYNVTVMAYGQTGSGKTYTMGTSDVSRQADKEQGLIPRFVADLFENLATRTPARTSTGVDAEADTEAEAETVTVTFCEIYGEDVFDLLPATTAAATGTSTGALHSTHSHAHSASATRPTLSVREDAKGCMFVQGQREVQVRSAEEALELLCRGTRTRITASTAMNQGSSRSHAVFTVTLQQFTCGEDEADIQDEEEEAACSSTGTEAEVEALLDAELPASLSGVSGVSGAGRLGRVRVESRLTFVDLAGSERLKRTGAEGQQLKEGIQINSGLFNLGRVINALADDQRLKQGALKGGKADFVPYRDNKLTHLLKDALGGNSQTLFLACVSPAEASEGETKSTLDYARKARNIQNAPVLNIDAAALEVRHLRFAVKAWMIKACGNMFATRPTEYPLEVGALTGAARLAASPLPPSLFKAAGAVAPHCAQSTAPAQARPAVGYDYDMALLQRRDVQEYVRAVNDAIEQQMSGSSSAGPRFNAGSSSSSNSSNSNRSSNAYASPQKATNPNPNPNRSRRPRVSLGKSPAKCISSVRTSLSHPSHPHPHMLHQQQDQVQVSVWPEAVSSVSESQLRGDLQALSDLQAAGDPEETERLVSRMIEMVSSEREAIGQQLETAAQEAGAQEVQGVDMQIEEKEAILAQLLTSVKGYASMKGDFELLMSKIGTYESERLALEMELEAAKRDEQRLGCSSAAALNAAAATATANGNSAVVERIRERFNRVKKELDSLKDERRRKESAYRLMQRESQQCEVMQKEIERMKSGRVQLLKTQRAQVSLFLKKDKETTSRLLAMRKLDTRKQAEVNSLKFDIVKKGRVLGHRDRELGRINGKLRACEDHISQLLRIQNKNKGKHQKLAGAGSHRESIVGSAGAGTNNGTLGHSNLSLGLSAADREHLSTSKALLDDLVRQRVERAALQDAYEVKQASLHALNEQVVAEAVQLECLLQRRTALEEQQEQLPTATAAYTTTTADNTTADAASVPLHPKVAVQTQEELQLVQESLGACEANIDRISRDLDIHNTDLGQLEVLLEQRRPVQAAGAGVVAGVEGAAGGHIRRTSRSNSITEASGQASQTDRGDPWEAVARAALDGLSPSQGQALVWQLLADQGAVLATQRSQREQLARQQQTMATLQGRATAAEQALDAVRSDGELLLVQAERRRVQDVWAVLSAGRAPPSPTSASGSKGSPGNKDSKEKGPAGGRPCGTLCEKGSAGVGSARTSADAETFAAVALQKARELEEQVLASSASSAAAAEQLAALQLEYARVCAELQESKLQMKLAKSSLADTGSDSAHAKEHERRTQHLCHLWSQLGVDTAERQQLADSLENARALAHERISSDLQQRTESATEEARTLREEAAAMTLALGGAGAGSGGATAAAAAAVATAATNADADVEAEAQTETADGSTVLARLALTKAAHLQAEGAFDERAARLTALVKRLAEVTADMWLRPSEVPALLQPLLSLPVGHKTATSSPELATRLVASGLALTPASFDRWEAALRTLNLRRVGATSKLVAVRDKTQALASALGLLDEETFRALVEAEGAMHITLTESLSPPGANSSAGAGVADSAFARARLAAVDLVLAKNKGGNPAGAEPLLRAAQLQHLLLESVAANRRAALLLSKKFLVDFRAGAGIETAEGAGAGGDNDSAAAAAAAAAAGGGGAVADETPVTRAVLTAAVQEAFDAAAVAQGSLPGLRARLQALYVQMASPAPAAVTASEDIDALLAFVPDARRLDVVTSGGSDSSRKTDRSSSSGRQSVAAAPSSGSGTKRRSTSSASVAAGSGSGGHSARTASPLQGGTCTGATTDDAYAAASNHALIAEKEVPPPPHAALAGLDALLGELASVALLAEEQWLSAALQELAADWHKADEGPSGLRCGREFVRQALVLHAECSRIQTLRSAQQTLLAADEQLMRHIADMEAFEATSKAGRDKILGSRSKGSSTALLAEERYRRNGKKKYEVITGHIFSAGATLQALLAEPLNGGCSSGGSGHLRVSADYSDLSAKSRDLLKASARRSGATGSSGAGTGREGELIHLHGVAASNQAQVPRRSSAEGGGCGGGDENESPCPPPAPAHSQTQAHGGNAEAAAVYAGIGDKDGSVATGAKSTSSSSSSRGGIPKPAPRGSTTSRLPRLSSRD